MPEPTKTLTSASALTALTTAAEANLRTGVLLLCKEALVTAIQDRRLERGHLRILAAIAECINAKTAKAWPGRSLIAAITGLSVKTVSNLLLELRNLGYLIADREAVEEADNRRLTVYTFGNIDHDTIRRHITEFVHALRAKDAQEKVPAHGELQRPRPRGTSPPTGNSESPKVPAHGERKSPPAGDSNSYKEQYREKGNAPQPQINGKTAMAAALNPEAAERKAYAQANVQVSKSGKVTIGPDFHAELIGEGYTVEHIDAGLARSCRYIEGSDPEKWMKTVRTACRWAKDADRSRAPARSRAGGSGVF